MWERWKESFRHFFFEKPPIFRARKKRGGNSVCGEKIADSIIPALREGLSNFISPPQRFLATLPKMERGRIKDCMFLGGGGETLSHGKDSAFGLGRGRPGPRTQPHKKLFLGVTTKKLSSFFGSLPFLLPPPQSPSLSALLFIFFFGRWVTVLCLLQSENNICLLTLAFLLHGEYRKWVLGLWSLAVLLPQLRNYLGLFNFPFFLLLPIWTPGEKGPPMAIWMEDFNFEERTHFSLPHREIEWSKKCPGISSSCSQREIFRGRSSSFKCQPATQREIILIVNFMEWRYRFSSFYSEWEGPYFLLLRRKNADWNLLDGGRALLLGTLIFLSFFPAKVKHVRKFKM